MWRLAFLSIISCSDPAPAKCGVGSAAPSIELATDMATLTYDTLESGANNDCPDPMAPAGVVSMTIERPSGMPPLFTLCVKRPDKLGGGLALGTDVKVIDVSGSAGGCTYALDSTIPPTGTAKSSGLCKNGSDPAGFALALDGTIALAQTCAGTTTSVLATVNGTVAVTPQ